MDGSYTKESVEEFSKKLQTAIKANLVLQELKKWLDHNLRDIEPQDWPNASSVRQVIRELEDK